jgi:hypothetical protein
MGLKSSLLMVGAGVVALSLVPSAAQAVTADRAAVVVVSEAPTDGLGPVVVPGPDAPRSYQIAADVPPGGSLTPAKPSDPAAPFSSEALVKDAKGRVVGAYDAPYAIDAKGRLLNATYRIKGDNLVQSVPVQDATAYPLTVLLADYAPVPAAGTSPQNGPTAAVSKVTVPSNYVYNPALGSLHDYCTSSPDSYLAADFRGPCARHDLCYEAPGNNKLACDNTLYQHLGNNCNYAYSSSNPIRATCVSVAAVYWAAVTAFGDDN